MNRPVHVAAGSEGAEIAFQVLEEAAEWYAALCAGDVSVAQRTAWETWLSADPAHRAAWQRVEAISRGMSAPRDHPQAADAALGAAARLHKRRRALRLLSMLAVAGAAGGTFSRTDAWRALQASLAADFSTRVGQRRELVLDDGSTVWLNTASALDQRFDDAARRLFVRRGEVMIETHPDQGGRARPFVVESEQGSMRALGTRFNVRQVDGATELDVYEGRVAVTLAGSRTHHVVAADHRARFTASMLRQQAGASAMRAMWSRGILLADEMPLGEVVAELARYRRGRLACDPAVAHLRVVGGFPLDRPGQALAMLEATLPIEIHAPLPWWVTVRAR